MIRHGKARGIARRAVLLGAAALTLMPRRGRARPDSVPAVLALLNKPASAARIGRRVAACCPALAVPGAARQHIDAALAEGRPDGDLRDRFSRRVRRDFAAGDVVTVDGWVLSRSEACLYVLAAQYRDGAALT